MQQCNVPDCVNVAMPNRWVGCCASCYASYTPSQIDPPTENLKKAYGDFPHVYGGNKSTIDEKRNFIQLLRQELFGGQKTKNTLDKYSITENNIDKVEDWVLAQKNAIQKTLYDNLDKSKYPILALEKLYKKCQSIDDKIDFINPLIHNSGMAKTLTEDGKRPCTYSSLETFTDKLGIKVNQDTYDEVKIWIENKYKTILKYQYNKLDRSTVPMYVKTEWPGYYSPMYGEVTRIIYTHWTVPLFSQGDLELGVKFKTFRPCGRQEHNGWVCPGGDERHKFGELHELLEEITKEEYDGQPEIKLTKEQYSQPRKGAAWSKNAAAHGFKKVK